MTISREAGSGGSASPGCWRAGSMRPRARTLCGGCSRATSRPRCSRPSTCPRVWPGFFRRTGISEICAYFGELVGLHPSLWDLVQKTNDAMRQLAREGAAIFVGRGANFATAGIDHGLHVRLIGRGKTWARYLAQSVYRFREAEALEDNAKCDVRRRRYTKAYFDADLSDPAAYDLVINTARVSTAAGRRRAAGRPRPGDGRGPAGGQTGAPARSRRARVDGTVTEPDLLARQ